MRMPHPRLLCGLACLACLLIYDVVDLARHVHGQAAAGHLQGSDFPVYYGFAKGLLYEPSTLYGTNEARHLGGYTYPPLSILLFLPFTPFRQTTAYLLFQAANVAALAFSCLLVLGARRHLCARENWAQRVCFTLLVVTSGPSFSSFVLGQVSAMVVVLCLGAVCLSQRRRHMLAGLALAFACWTKVYPTLLLVAMLASRTHRMSGLMTLLFGILLPACFLWVVPFHLYAKYFLEVLPTLSAGIAVNVYNQSIAAWLARLSLPYDQWMSWGVVKAGLWIRIVNALVLLGAMALLVARRVRRSQDFLLVSLLALSLVPLIGPLGWGHSFLFSVFLVSYCIVFPESDAGCASALLAWLFLLVPAYSGARFLQSMPPLVRTAVHIRYPMAVALVFGIALRDLWAQHWTTTADATNAPRPAAAG